MVSIGIAWSIIFAIVCVYLAGLWGRNKWAWGILGFFFSVIALVVLIVLEKVVKKGPGNGEETSG